MCLRNHSLSNKALPHIRQARSEVLSRFLPPRSTSRIAMLERVRKRRVWTEFLSPDVLGATETLDVLQRYRLQPLIAMPPGREGPAMAEALRSLHDAGVPFGIWPLLSDSDGYWPGSANAKAAAARVHQLLAMARKLDVPVRTIALDLEPNLELKRSVLAMGQAQRLRHLGERFVETARRVPRQEHQDAVKVYSQLASQLRATRVESLAIAVPPLALDLVAGSEFWQSFFRTPLTAPGWDTQSPMYYRSMIQEALPGKSPLLGRAIFAEACRLWAAQPGPACMSLGVVGPGKLADEASYQGPGELAWDVACATAAGLDDLALFSLESVLESQHPGQWLDAFTQPAATAVPSRRERVARTSLRGLLQVTGGLTRWL